MADHDYSLLGLITLDAGSWADWFSGTMSFGAVVTALAGYVIVHRQRMADNLDRERQVAESIGWKLLRVYNDTATVAKHLREQLSRAGSIGSQTMRFMTVQPLGIPDRQTPELTQAEVSLLIKIRASNIMMDLNDSILRYDSIRFAMDQYKSRHEDLFKMMPTPVEMQGAVATHRLSREEMAKVKPYAAMLDELLGSIIELVAEGAEKGEAIMQSYCEAMKGYFGKWHFTFEGDRSQTDLTVFRSCDLPR